MQTYFSLITQELMSYTVKILFTRAVPIWATPEYIQQQAHVISAQRFQAEYNQFFLPNYKRGVSRENLSLHALKAAGFIIDTFSSAWTTIGQTVQIPKGRRMYQELKMHVHTYKCIV